MPYLAAPIANTTKKANRYPGALPKNAAYNSIRHILRSRGVVPLLATQAPAWYAAPQ
jgi:hypothetical protein